MLKIRQEQFNAMRESAQAGFDAGMLAHLRKHFAAQTASQSDDQLLATIRAGRRSAWSYGGQDPEAICRFIDVRVALGPEFDSDPRYAWIVAPLRDHTVTDPDARIEELAERAVQWLSSHEAERTAS
jgi:hypothetical protein